MNKERSKAIVRLVVQIIVTVNMILTMAGKNPLPFDETIFTEWLTALLLGASTIWIWWKNNNVTKNAQYAQESLNALKTDFVDDGEIEEEI